jgi:hypothetical protein
MRADIVGVSHAAAGLTYYGPSKWLANTRGTEETFDADSMKAEEVHEAVLRSHVCESIVDSVSKWEELKETFNSAFPGGANATTSQEAEYPCHLW